MAFDSLTEKLQNVFKNLRSKGRLTEDDVKAALREVKMALLEADVNFKVVKNFVKSVQERAVVQDVMRGLNPGQMVIKIVNDELVNLMGSETTEIKFQTGSQKTVIMMKGLVMSTDLQLLNSWRSTESSRVGKCSPWEIIRSRRISLKQHWSMLKRMATM